ncbi:Firmicu-CTERM sorting domain-containing protein [Leuconostoc mesenteroides]|uniref:Firmicu-CTERM sorting domain-containing protein n=1 Tax=Leuconostoc mesenteroides TaxID=1245 RepID=UPI0037BEF13C
MYPSPVKADTANNYNITIDGNFEDWADKPKTDIFFDYNNGNVTKQGSFLSDDKYLYIYGRLQELTEHCKLLKNLSW